MNNKTFGLILVLAFVILGIGFLLGQDFQKDKKNSNMMDTFEETLDNLYDIQAFARFFNKNTTIENAINIYYSHTPLSRWYASYELQKICTGINPY